MLLLAVFVGLFLRAIILEARRTNQVTTSFKVAFGFVICAFILFLYWCGTDILSSFLDYRAYPKVAWFYMQLIGSVVIAVLKSALIAWLIETLFPKRMVQAVKTTFSRFKGAYDIIVKMFGAGHHSHTAK